MATTLLISLANGGYQYLYKNNIESHRQYAEKQGYEYIVVDRPNLLPIGMEIVWLKIFLIREALLSGYEWVAFVDADACINHRTPPLETLLQVNKCIYMARGYSGRFNSGVMLFRNNRQSRIFIEDIIKSMNDPIPPEDDVVWGENGHVIHFSKQNPYVQEIDKRWNNNHQPELNDYIRHFSAGPLRKLYRANLLDILKFKLYRKFTSVYRKIYLCMIDKEPKVKDVIESILAKHLKNTFPSL